MSYEVDISRMTTNMQIGNKNIALNNVNLVNALEVKKYIMDIKNNVSEKVAELKNLQRFLYRNVPEDPYYSKITKLSKEIKLHEMEIIEYEKLIYHVSYNNLSYIKQINTVMDQKENDVRMRIEAEDARRNAIETENKQRAEEEAEAVRREEEAARISELERQAAFEKAEVERKRKEEEKRKRKEEKERAKKVFEEAKRKAREAEIEMMRMQAELKLQEEMVYSDSDSDMDS